MRGEMTVDTLSDTIFSGHPEKRFAITTLNPHSRPSLEESLHHAYHQFRADIYIDKFGILGDDARTADGIEFDGDDERAQHFIVVENRLGHSALVGCMRLITKDKEADLLPVEKAFPDTHSDRPAEVGSVEVSRFIVDHGGSLSDTNRNGITDRVFMVALAHLSEHGLKPAYAIVEDWLETRLSQMRVPIEPLSEPRLLPEYGSSNFSARIDIDRMVSQYDALARRRGSVALRGAYLEEGQWQYWGSHQVIPPHGVAA